LPRGCIRRQRFLYWNAAIFEAVQQLSVVADKVDIPLTELALRWLVSKPAAGPILLGGSKVEHLRSNIDAVAKGPLDDQLVEACDDVGAALRGPMPNYNR
jgi:aryl-alcohol dehydrogenase-like predicted oxidoreductase